ncbi:hypothetical protein N7E02_24225 [Aliirhizobium terrae]|uniref:hypothetical protein n=1 Tax=Terrirhizobium terrae TaxID=2926709 RepID=UPI0025786E09|nr:hypothetical protein [Rhizobium sp. CC-CFT758]WJH39805.1 hypothetical protein N7E02_24225 [Rhizobium sp. CC-CFT758]
MDAAKAKLSINGVPQELVACGTLKYLPDNICHHRRIPCRHPLGIYNVSTGKIFRQIDLLSSLTKRFFNERSAHINGKPSDFLLEDITERIELLLHAAAAHVDDVEMVCRTLFKHDRDYAKSPNVRVLKRELKPIRDRVSSYTNFIKHSHNAIRIFESELKLNQDSILFPGFFLESSDGDQLMPNPLFHGNGNPVLSLSTLIWEVFFFVIKTSHILKIFIEAETKINTPEEDLSKTTDSIILQISEIPLYYFGEEHPLIDKPLFLEINDEIDYTPLEGALTTPWQPDRLAKCEIGYWAYRYQGDGVTRSMAIQLPRQLKLFNV